MEALGPGTGPAAPMQLIGFLRRPLGELLCLTEPGGDPDGSADDAISEAVLLSPDVYVPKTSSASCDQAIFVDQATDANLSCYAVLLKVDRFG
jgi:hypothetical protein